MRSVLQNPRVGSQVVKKIYNARDTGSGVVLNAAGKNYRVVDVHAESGRFISKSEKSK